MNNVNNPFSTIDAYERPQTPVASNKGTQLQDFANSLNDFFQKGSQAFTTIQKSKGEENKIKAVKDHLQGKYEIPDELFNKGFGYHEAWQMLEGKSKALELEAQTNQMIDELKPEAFDLNMDDEKVMSHASQLFDDQFKTAYTGADPYALLGAEDHISKNKAEYIQKYLGKFRGVKKAKSLDSIGKAFNALTSTDAFTDINSLAKELSTQYAIGTDVGLTKDDISDRLLSTVGVQLADAGRVEDLKWLTSEFVSDPESGIAIKDTKYAKTVDTLMNAAERKAYAVTESQKLEALRTLESMEKTIQSLDDVKVYRDTTAELVSQGKITAAQAVSREEQIIKAFHANTAKASVGKYSFKFNYKVLADTFDMKESDAKEIVHGQMKRYAEQGDLNKVLELSKLHNLPLTSWQVSLQSGTTATEWSEEFEMNNERYNILKDSGAVSLYLSEKEQAFYEVYTTMRALNAEKIDGFMMSPKDAFAKARLIYDNPDAQQLGSATYNRIQQIVKTEGYDNLQTQRLTKMTRYMAMVMPQDVALEKAEALMKKNTRKVGWKTQSFVSNLPEDAWETLLKAAVWRYAPDNKANWKDYTLQPIDPTQGDSGTFILLEASGGLPIVPTLDAPDLTVDYLSQLSGYLGEMREAEEEADDVGWHPAIQEASDWFWTEIEESVDGISEIWKALGTPIINSDYVEKQVVPINKDTITGKHLKDNPFNLTD